jgi:hypothetical protein
LILFMIMLPLDGENNPENDSEDIRNAKSSILATTPLWIDLHSKR